jgi:glycosyltransferase involved in cell wall biosynthesis
MSKPPLLVFADDWGRHPSSCQHLVNRLKTAHPILWINTVGTRSVKLDGFTFARGFEKIRNWCRGLRQVDSRMWVLDVPMLPSQGGRWSSALNPKIVGGFVRRAMRRLSFEQPVVVTTLPHALPSILRVPRLGLVYYAVDDFSHWPGADGEAVRGLERRLLDECDAVLAASTSLQERLSEHRTAQYFPHAVDFELFTSVDRVEEAAAIAALPQPRIGFFGLIYEKLDFDLLAACARRFPSATLVLIGPVDFCPPHLRELPNVRFLGGVPYAELPSYLRGLDVLLLVYGRDEMTRQINPLKIKECLASGKPTVCVDIPEARRFAPEVRIAASEEEYLQAVAAALDEGAAPEAIERRRAIVRGDGWSRRADEFEAIVDGLIDSRELCPSHA